MPPVWRSWKHDKSWFSVSRGISMFACLLNFAVGILKQTFDSNVLHLNIKKGQKYKYICIFPLYAMGYKGRFVDWILRNNYPISSHMLKWRSDTFPRYTCTQFPFIFSVLLRKFNAIWRHRSGSTLSQVLACCLTAPSHNLNQCWFIISTVMWHSSEGIIIRRYKDTNQ